MKGLLKLVLRRLLMAIPLVLLVSALSFTLTSLLPGSPAQVILGLNATPEAVAELNAKMGFDKPLWEQYVSWLAGALHGDLGDSFTSGVPVTDLIASRLPPTLALVIGGTLVTAVGGVAIGVYSARRPNTKGRIADVFQLLGMAIPNFWLGLVLIQIFAVDLRLFPVSGYVRFETSPWDWFRSLVLPLAALSIPMVTGIAKQTRDGVRDALSSEYVKALRACGTPEWRVIYLHALKNASIPILTYVGLLFIGLVSGTIFIETVFGYPGLGGLAQTATQNQDLLLVQGVALVYCLVAVGCNLVTDIAYGLVNPKARIA